MVSGYSDSGAIDDDNDDDDVCTVSAVSAIVVVVVAAAALPPACPVGKCNDGEEEDKFCAACDGFPILLDPSPPRLARNCSSAVSACLSGLRSVLDSAGGSWLEVLSLFAFARSGSCSLIVSS